MMAGRGLRLLSGLIFGLTVTVLNIGCTKEPTDADIIVSADEFPIIEKLDSAGCRRLDVPSYGITEIRVADSMLIVSVNDNREFWHLYALPGADSLGRILNVGSGPNEFLMPMVCVQASFLRDENGYMTATVPMMLKPKMLTFSLKGGNVNNQDIIDGEVDNVESSNTTVWIYRLDKQRMLKMELDLERMGVKREIIPIGSADEAQYSLATLDSLSRKTVDDMAEIPLLLTRPAIKPDGTLVAEIPGFGNTINLYSTLTGENKQIVYSGLERGESDLKEMVKDDKELLNGGFGYEEFFTLLRNEYDESGLAAKYLDFFDWDGKPLGSLQLPGVKIRRCDIDMANGTLYFLEAEKDEIFSADVSSFLSKISAK